MNEKKLKVLIQEAVIEALTAEITWEKKTDEKTGLPLAAPEYKVEKVFLPAFWIQHLKLHEGAARGLHEDVSKKNNLIDGMSAKMGQVEAKLEVVGNVLLGLEGAAKTLAALADRVKERYPEIGATPAEKIGGEDGEGNAG